MQFAQIRDRITTESREDNAIDLSRLIGTWVNSNPDTNGVARMAVTQSDGKLSLQVYAIGPDGLLDWGLADLTLFTASPSSTVAAGFTCLYDFGFAQTQLQAMILKGLIVLAQIHRFKDDSKRADYFVREYFALDHGRY
jgi:hypothetical protein